MLTPWDPLGYKVSHFRQSRRISFPASQAVGPLWEFRWGTTAGHLCFVTRVTLKGIENANMAAQELGFNLTVARGFTAVDSVNTVSILRSGNNQKLNASAPASVLTSFVESNSATAPSGGTYTQDSDPIIIGAYSTVATPTVDGSADVLFDYLPSDDGDQMLRLAKNEGFIINNTFAHPNPNAFIAYLDINWVEAYKP